MILTKEDYIPGNQLLFCKNVKITQSLLHEIEHAKQAKIMDERKDDEAEILKVTGTSKSQEIIRDRLTSLGMGQSIIKVILNNKLKICADYYNFGPHERLAEINSNEKMLEIIDPLKNFTPNVYNLINAGFASNRVRGYKLNNQLISPTIYFLKKQEEYVNLLHSYNLDIAEGKWLFEMLTYKILDKILEKQKIKKEEISIAILVNDLSENMLSNIRIIAKEYKRVNIVTNHIEKFKKIEKKSKETAG